MEELEPRTVPANLALHLDGVSAYASAPNNALLDLGTGAGDDFTIETSFYVSDPARAANQLLILKNNAYSIFFNSNGLFARLYVDPIGDKIQLQPLQPLSAGWHHVAAEFNQQFSANQDLFALYFDGNLVASDSNFKVTPGINSSSSALYIGANAGAVPFAGWMDETRFSNSVRYIGSTYMVPTQPFTPDANTVALWRFDELAGATSFADSSGNGLTLTGWNGAQTGAPPSSGTTAPTVTAIAPTSGPTAGGTSVTITGTNFTAGSTVKFGTLAATSVTFVSATSLTAIAPAEAAGTVDVTVTTAGVTSAAGPADQYTFVAAPAVTVIAPTSGPTTGGTSVTITGTNFTAASTVKFGTVAASSVIFVSTTSLIAVAPPEAAGTVDVTVTTTGITSVTVAADRFTFVPATPTQLAITNLSPTSITAGGTVAFTVMAEDSTGQPVPGYTGTVQLTSTDAHAVAGAIGLPASYTFVGSDNGAHTFTVMLETAGSQTITATDQANSLTVTSPIAVNTGPVSKFVVSVPGGNTTLAGNPFLFTAQATDQFGNPVSSYSGPANVTATPTPADPQSSFHITGTLNSSGFALFLGNLRTAGSYTLTAAAGSFSGTTASLTVSPSAANYFAVNAPAAATTGSPFNVTVTAYDHFGNISTGYAGTVKLTSTDSATATLVGSYTFTTGVGKDNGVHTFSATLKTGGSQTITATDTSSTNPTITGSSSVISTRGLTVSAFTPTATGFMVTFSKPIVPADLTLFGGTGASPIQNVTLVGTTNGPVNGSLVLDSTDTIATFKASATYLSTFFSGSTVLPNDTWKATLVSGTGTGATANGFFDALGAPLDGAGNGGHANYTTTFTTANDGKMALSIPDLARGPDGASTIKVPNDTSKGIPVTLSNVPASSGVKDVVFTLSYNPTLFVPTAGGTGDSSGTGSTFVMGTPASVDGTHSTVTFTWHNGTAQSGTVVLGDILANVPNSAANQYKGKEILGIVGSSITVNGAAFTGVWANGLHVNAYFGDGTGDGKITGLDVATASTVAGGSAAGLVAYRLVDPAIIGDIAGDASIDATAVSDLAAFTSNLNPPQIPAPLTGLAITPGGPDPTLSLAGGVQIGDIVSVLLDHPRPEGSAGMTEAILALTYDPSMLSVSSSDITVGSIPGLGAGWHLVSVVDQVTGQIGIDLYSATAITAAQAGSLVHIAFHVVPGVSVPTTAVQLVNSVAPNGHWFSTEVADSQSQFVLSPGRDRLVVETGVSPLALAAPSGTGTVVTAAVIHGQASIDAQVQGALEETAEIGSLLLGTEGNDVLAVISNGAVAGETPALHALSAYMAVTGALAFQTTLASPLAGQLFQFGSLPLHNMLLYRNSPAQLAADQVFLALARWTEAPVDNSLNLFQNNLGSDAPLDQDWLASQASMVRTPGKSSVTSLDQQATDQQNVSDRIAVVDKVYARLADDMDDFSDLGDF